MRLKPIFHALVLVGLVTAPFASSGQTSAPPLPTVISTVFDAATIERDTPVKFVFDAIPTGSSVHVLWGSVDLSGLLRADSATEFVYPSAELPLPPGVSELVISVRLASGEELEVKRAKITVRARANEPVETARLGTNNAGAESADTPVKWGPFTPKFDIASPLSRTVTNSTAADGTQTRTASNLKPIGFQAGLQLNSPALGGELTGSAQITGNSDRKQALRYSTAQGDATKIDLASYALDWKNETTAAGLGNANFAPQHPLLWQSNNRGAFVTQKLGSRFDVGVAAQNATPIVGFPNAVGLYSADHHFAAAVAGVELVPDRAKALRVELFVVDAAQSSALPPPVPPDPLLDPLHASTLRPCKDSFELQQVVASGNTTTCDTNVAPVSQSQSAAFQASRSRGFGVRALASTEDQAMRADLAWANSRHQDLANANTPGAAATGQRAWQADLGYDVIKNHPLSEKFPFSLTTTAKYEYADPFYKSLSGPWQSDYRQSTAVANITLGAITASLNDMRRQDNVARDLSRLRNHSDSQNFTTTIPFGQLLSAKDAKPDPVIPSLSLNALRMKMYGRDVPTAIDVATVADSITTTVGGTLNWTSERWTASYGINRSYQDNRQVGSEEKDQRTLGHSVNATWRPTEHWNLNANFAPTRMFARDTGIVTTRTPIQIGVNFNDAAAKEGWTMLGNANYERSHDSAGQASGKTYGLNLAVGRKVLLPSFWGRKMPGQVQLRYTLNSSNTRSTDLTTLVVSDTRQKSTVVMLDFTLSLF